MNEIMAVLPVNGVAIILMVITLFSLRKNLKSGVFADKVFFLLTLGVLIVSAVEIICVVFNGQTFLGAKGFNRFFNSLLFAVNPIPAFLWALYATVKVKGLGKNIYKTALLLSIPLVCVIFLSSLNLFVDVFFTITEQNLYMRTNFYAVATMLSCVYFVYVTVFVILQRKNIGRNLVFPLLSFMILPIMGIALQFVFFGMYFLWVSAAVSIIIIFNHVQNDSSITDWLTGLYNRRHLDYYLQQACKKKREQQLIGLMLDIDSFKHINDTYGHMTGDQALRDMAKIIKSSLGKKEYLARYAGDEFVMILERDSQADAEKLVQKIHNEINVYNKHTQEVFKLSASIGYAIYKGADIETPDDFLFRMDEQMYLAKKSD